MQAQEIPGQFAGPACSEGFEQNTSSWGAVAVNTFNVIGGQSINAVNAGFNLRYLDQEYGSVNQLKQKSIDGVKSLAGYAIGYTAAAAVILEQSPINENWRVKEGIKTLVATANPAAVARRIIEITNYIELSASALIIAAVFSKSPIVEAPKEAFYKWTEMGAKREEFRDVTKQDEKRVKNNWRVAKEQFKAAPEAERRKVKNNWLELVRAEELAAEEAKREKDLQDTRIKNDLRVASGKKSKESRIQKRLNRNKSKEDEKRVKNNWKELKKADKLERKEAKEEQRLVKLRNKNNLRVASGKKPKSELSLSKRGEKRVGKELEDLAVALGLGAGIVVFKNALRDREYTVRQALIDAVKASLEISLVSGFIGWTVATGAEKAKIGITGTNHTIHFEKQAQWVVDYGLNTKFIIGTLLLAQSPSIIKKLRHRLPDKEREFQKWLASQEPELATEQTV